MLRTYPGHQAGKSGAFAQELKGFATGPVPGPEKVEEFFFLCGNAAPELTGYQAQPPRFPRLLKSGALQPRMGSSDRPWLLKHSRIVTAREWEKRVQKTRHLVATDSRFGRSSVSGATQESCRHWLIGPENSEASA